MNVFYERCSETMGFWVLQLSISHDSFWYISVFLFWQGDNKHQQHWAFLPTIQQLICHKHLLCMWTFCHEIRYYIWSTNYNQCNYIIDNNINDDDYISSHLYTIHYKNVDACDYKNTQTNIKESAKNYEKETTLQFALLSKGNLLLKFFVQVDFQNSFNYYLNKY